MKNILLIMLATIMVLMASGCGSPGRQQQEDVEGILVVANKSGNDVHFVSRSTGEILAQLPAGLQPHEVEVSEDGEIAVVCNYGDGENPGNSLSVYSVSEARLLMNIDLGEHTRPHGMQWMPGTHSLLVTAEGSGHLLVVDVLAGQVVQAFPTRQQVSHMVAASPAMGRAFVPSLRSGYVTVIDLQSGQILAQVFSGQGAEGVDVSPDGREVWVTNRGENTISIIDTQTLEVLGQVPCEDFPIRGKFSPDGSLFLVSNARSGDIAVFDTRARLMTHRIPLTPPAPSGEDNNRFFHEFQETSVPIGIVIPDNQWAYVANTRSDAISVIDLETFEITEHFLVGREPDGIGFSPIHPQVR